MFEKDFAEEYKLYKEKLVSSADEFFGIGDISKLEPIEKIKTYEYGVKETKSCGSGSISSFYVCNMLGLVDDTVDIISSGGTHKCVYINSNYYLIGSSTIVYKGEYYGI